MDKLINKFIIDNDLINSAFLELEKAISNFKITEPEDYIELFSDSNFDITFSKINKITFLVTEYSGNKICVHIDLYHNFKNIGYYLDYYTFNSEKLEGYDDVLNFF